MRTFDSRSLKSGGEGLPAATQGSFPGYCVFVSKDCLRPLLKASGRLARINKGSFYSRQAKNGAIF